MDVETFNHIMGLCEDDDGGPLIWSHGAGGVDEVPVVLQQESAARELFCYQTMGIPALVQSEDYMRAAFNGRPHLPPGEVERCVSARLARQRVLDGRKSVRCTFVLRELSLRHLGDGGKVAVSQLAHLLRLSHMDKVDVRVLERDVPFGYWNQHLFTLILSSEFRPVVHIDFAPFSLFLDQPEESGVYEHSARLLLANAMSAEQSRAFIAHLAGRVGASAESRS